MSEASPKTGRNAKVIAAAVVAGLLGSGTLVWQASSAAFTATTDNASNSWDSGNVVLSNNLGAAMFPAAAYDDLVPGASDTKCILVEYDGDVAAAVKLYITVPGGTLAQYIDMHVQKGTGDCTDNGGAAFGSKSTVFGDGDGVLTAGEDTLTELAGHTNWGSGVSTGWTPSAANSVVPFLFKYTLVNTGNNDAMNKSATNVTFTWEAQNT